MRWILQFLILTYIPGEKMLLTAYLDISMYVSFESHPSDQSQVEGLHLYDTESREMIWSNRRQYH